MVFAIPFEKPEKIQAVIWGHAFRSFFFLPSAELAALYMYFSVTMGPYPPTISHSQGFGQINSVYGKISMGEWVKIKYNLCLLHTL